MLKYFIFSFLFIHFLAVLSQDINSEWMEPNNINEINVTDTPGNITIDSPDEELTWILNINTNDKSGYGIKIRVDQLSVNSSEDEYLLLAGGKTADDDSVMVQIITGTYDTPLYFILPNATSVYVKLSTAEGFLNLTYDRYEEDYEQITPPPVDPTPPATIDTTYQVILTGRPPVDYYNDPVFSLEFKYLLVNISKVYCNETHIPVDEKPVDEMIQLWSIFPCSPEWPEYKTCAAINHSIYVSGEISRTKDKLKDYELTAVHLHEMWENAKITLGEHNLSVYKIPDSTDIMLWWLLILGICIIVIVASLVVFWRFDYYFSQKMIEEQPLEIFEGVEIRNKNKNRLSEYQNIPTYMTEPDSVLKYSKGSHRDKKAPKPPALSNLQNYEPTSPQQQSPLSPTTPAGEYSAGLYFNYNRAFVETDEDGLEI